MSHLSDDRLLDLANVFTDESARRGALRHLASCSECETRFMSFVATHERGRARVAAGRGAHASSVSSAEPAGAPRAPHLRVVEPLRGPARPRSRPARNWRGLAVAAAAVVTVVGTLSLLDRGHGPAPMREGPDAWLPAADPSVVNRDPSTPAPDARVVEGLTAYERHDLVESRRLLEATTSSGSMEQVRRVYLASAQLRLGDPSAALATLRGVAWASVPEPWRGESEWALYLALGRTGHRAEADSLLAALAERQGAVGDRARAVTTGRGAGP